MHISIQRHSFYCIIIFYLIGNKSRLPPVSGTKAIFMLKVAEKQGDEIQKGVYPCPSLDLNVTHEETRNLITAANILHS